MLHRPKDNVVYRYYQFTDLRILIVKYIPILIIEKFLLAYTLKI